ncbi:MAG: hypothetical protein ABEJ56_05700 [Candidatus Nanohaloarchaea archaeon]
MTCPACGEGGVIEEPDEESFDAFDPEDPPWDYGCRHCGYAWSED